MDLIIRADLDLRPADTEARLVSIEAKLDRLLAGLHAVLIAQEMTMTDLTDITDAVADLTTVEQGAVALLNHLADELEANAGDPAALAALAASIRSDSSDLAAAVAANTVAAPAPDQTETPAEPAPVEDAPVDVPVSEVPADQLGEAPDNTPAEDVSQA